MLFRSRILKRKDQFYDFIKDKYLPLDLFLKFEKELKIPRKDIMLSTGKGNSYFIIPNIIKVNKNFCRLLGYYLSEGCQTTEKTTRRIRFTFHRDEKEYINDVKLILNKLKIKYSEWQDPRWKNHHIKISSELLGRVFDWLGCGKNCYEMKIPEQFFLSNPSFRLELLKGLFRGDGGVSVKKGKQTYTKKEKQYTNNINSIEISYFSSSRILLEQVQLILREQGIINSLEKRSGLIRIKTLEGFIKSKNWFLGEKKIKIEKYLKDKQKSSDYKYAEIKQDSILLLVSSVKKLSAKEYVYSLEIEPNKTLITNGGIIAHNCIPLDPFYLTYAARLAGKDTKFIELAGQINRNMPEYVVEQARDILNQYEMSLKGSNVLLIGITYKPNIDDSRESPALDILKILKEKGANVRFYDPYVTKIKDFEQKKAKVNNEEAKSIELKEKIIQMQDLVIITTNHAGIDYNLILKNAKAIYDTRNAFNDIKDKKIFRGYEIN